MKEFAPGFKGNDAMREKAKQLLGGEMKDSNPTEVKRAPKINHGQPTPYYKKGGAVKCMNQGGMMTREYAPSKVMAKPIMPAAGHALPNLRKPMPAMSDGGMVDKRHGGAIMNKAEGFRKMVSPAKMAMGGTVYEKAMDGEKHTAKSYAAGGVAKVRKGECSKSGKPLSRRMQGR